METTVLDVPTGAHHLTDLTNEVTRFCQGRGDGLLHVFAPHATAGLALLELARARHVAVDRPRRLQRGQPATTRAPQLRAGVGSVT